MSDPRHPDAEDEATLESVTERPTGTRDLRDPMTGRRIGSRYEILEPLGAGDSAPSTARET